MTTDATLDDAQAEAAPEAAEQPPEKPRTADVELYRYSGWLHVGPGADDCEAVDEEKGENECGNPLHFHAWCRLPNQFQHREIREKAHAAKARRARQLRDPATDGYEVLEDELDRIARAGDDGKTALVEEVAGKDWWDDTLEAAKDLADEEDEHGQKRWARIDSDQERMRELRAMPEDERPADEWDELRRHLNAYDEALDKAIEARVKPKKDALADRDISDLIDMVRDDRIDRDAHEEFSHVYAEWEWFHGTLRKPGGDQVFTDRKQMYQAAPEALAAMQQLFGELERSQAKGAQGNS